MGSIFSPKTPAPPKMVAPPPPVDKAKVDLGSPEDVNKAKSKVNAKKKLQVPLVNNGNAKSGLGIPQ